MMFPDPLIKPYAFFHKLIVDSLIGHRFLIASLMLPILALFLPNARRKDQTVLFFLYVVFGISFILLAANIIKYWFLERQFLWTIPVFILWLGWCANSVINNPWNDSQLIKKIIIRTVQFFVIAGISCFLIYESLFLPGINLLVKKVNKSPVFEATLLQPAAPHSLTPFINLVNKNERMERDQLINYYYFLKNVLTYHSPMMAEIQTLSAYCAFLLNAPPEYTLNMLQTAAQLKPDNFWYHYNLAAFFVDNRQYQQAIPFLLTALKIPPQETIAFEKKSFHYEEFLKALSSDDNLLLNRIRQGRQSAWEMLILCYWNMKDMKSVGEACQAGLNEQLKVNDRFFNYFLNLLNNPQGPQTLDPSLQNYAVMLQPY
ncbi:MAG: hypothetical protein HQL26_10900 [Candidatus Omnitrophica bacterium]|nr:hypothetical protein [Candidatus Omnitrophota bacterium]